MNFELPYLPDRGSKPRNAGVTMVMDKGLSMREAENLIETSGDLIDLLKLGFGTSIVTKSLADKIKRYHDNNIMVYFGGTLFEAFYVRGMLEDYLRLVDKFKLETIEVSDGSIVMSSDEKCEVIARLSKKEREFNSLNK